MSSDIEKINAQVDVTSPTSSEITQNEKKSLRHRIREIVWDSLDQDPKERKLVFKIDLFILYVNPIYETKIAKKFPSEHGQASHISLRISTQITFRMHTYRA